MSKIKVLNGSKYWATDKDNPASSLPGTWTNSKACFKTESYTIGTPLRRICNPAET